MSDPFVRDELTLPCTEDVSLHQEAGGGLMIMEDPCIRNIDRRANYTVTCLPDAKVVGRQRGGGEPAVVAHSDRKMLGNMVRWPVFTGENR